MVTTINRLKLEFKRDNRSHAVNGTSAPKKRRRPRRAVNLAMLIVALILAWRYGLPWADYRLTHVVTHKAVVVGDFTPIGARIDGQIKKLEVEPGQRVHRGEVMALLEDSHLRSRVTEAKANLNRAVDEHSAQAAYVDQQRKLLEVQLKRAEADVELAAAKLVEAKSEQTRWEREFKRTQRLLVTGAASQSRMDEVRANRGAKEAVLEAAKAQQRAADVDYHRADVDREGIEVHLARLKVLVSNIEMARCELNTAQADLDAATIRAPEDGWVVQSDVGPGASVKVGQPILKFWSCDRFLVEARVNESSLSDIEIGAPADVTLPAYRGEVFAGRVEAICPVFNDVEQAGLQSASPLLPNSNHFCVWIRLNDVDRPLLPGLSAIVGIDR